MVQLLNMTMNDGSRHFAALPESKSWYELRDCIAALPGAQVTDFITDRVVEAWIDFTYRGHRFSAKNQFGEFWFFVQDPACREEILDEVALHCAGLLGDSPAA